MLLVVQHAIGVRVGHEHEVLPAEAFLAEPLGERFDAHRDHGELVLRPPPLVRVDGAPEVGVGDDVAVDEDEVRADDVPVVDQAHGLARADAVRGDDRVHDEPGGLRPRAGLEVRDDLLGVRAAKHKHLLDAVRGEELERVLDHRDVHEGEQDLRALERDRAEALRGGGGRGARACGGRGGDARRSEGGGRRATVRWKTGRVRARARSAARKKDPSAAPRRARRTCAKLSARTTACSGTLASSPLLFFGIAPETEAAARERVRGGEERWTSKSGARRRRARRVNRQSALNTHWRDVIWLTSVMRPI